MEEEKVQNSQKALEQGQEGGVCKQTFGAREHRYIPVPSASRQLPNVSATTGSVQC